jgi:hypothetical protein
VLDCGAERLPPTRKPQSHRVQKVFPWQLLLVIFVVCGSMLLGSFDLSVEETGRCLFHRRTEVQEVGLSGEFQVVRTCFLCVPEFTVLRTGSAITLPSK